MSSIVVTFSQNLASNKTSVHKYRECCCTTLPFLRVSRYTFRGSNSIIDIFVSIMSEGQLLRVTDLLLQEQIFYF